VPLQDRQSLERDCFPPQTIQDGGTGFTPLQPDERIATATYVAQKYSQIGSQLAEITRLESNADSDRNNLCVDSGGGGVVITRLEIETVARLTHFNSETNSAIRAQSP